MKKLYKNITKYMSTKCIIGKTLIYTGSILMLVSIFMDHLQVITSGGTAEIPSAIGFIFGFILLSSGVKSE
jgi:hypothetical protein